MTENIKDQPELPPEPTSLDDEVEASDDEERQVIILDNTEVITIDNVAVSDTISNQAGTKGAWTLVLEVSEEVADLLADNTRETLKVERFYESYLVLHTRDANDRTSKTIMLNRSEVKMIWAETK